MMKIARLKKQTKLVTPFVRVIKKSQLAVVLPLKTMTNNYIRRHIRIIVYLHAYSTRYNIGSSVALHY